MTNGAIVEEVVWRLPQSDDERPHRLKYSLVYIRDGRRVVGYDNERGKGDHRHYGNTEEPYDFVSIDQLLANFNPNLSQIMLDLACLLIPQEIFPQSAVVTDTPLLRKFPCETNILRDIGANLWNFRVKADVEAEESKR